MKRLAFTILGLLTLAGCTSSQPLKPRIINIAATPSPASAQIAGSIQHLVDQTNTTYVTLVVHNAPTKNQRKKDELPEPVASGSGFLVDSQGTVVTAGHVGMEKGWLVEARGPDGRIYQGTVEALSYSPDVAIVKLRGMEGSAAVKPASSPCLHKGQPVFSLGKPRAEGDIARTGELVATHFERPVTYSKFGYPDAMVLKLSTRRGESGGPVFNDRGELIGMLVSTLSDKNTGAPLDLAHALPAPMIARVLCQATSCSPEWRLVALQTTAQCPSS
ncbi:S1 family peptidase [Rhodoligotrophos defluvii]|uniref:S1 family peptidase n=1 Tax=Rhodoligotrophos defluvii TaxID=2561934 RepID=UPI0010C9C104|nr:serine protease [Rhodoligotrophos defluvii]